MTDALCTIKSAVQRPLTAFNKCSTQHHRAHSCVHNQWIPTTEPSLSQQNPMNHLIESTSVAPRYPVDESTRRRFLCGCQGFTARHSAQSSSAVTAMTPCSTVSTSLEYVTFLTVIAVSDPVCLTNMLCNSLLDWVHRCPGWLVLLLSLLKLHSGIHSQPVLLQCEQPFGTLSQHPGCRAHTNCHEVNPVHNCDMGVKC